jgi:hypothetical protein
MKLKIATLLAAVTIATTANAQAVKSEVTASNGVKITVYSDSFANRFEFTAPTVKSDPVNLMVATVKKGGTVSAIKLEGFAVYSGEWKKYNSAIFKGGDAAKFTTTQRRVGSCSSSCTLIEEFNIAITPAEVKAHAENGIVALQVRSQTAEASIVEIPVSYFEAINEVANRK